MEKEKIESGLRQAFRDITGKDFAFSDESTFDDLEDWDSINTVRLMVSLQTRFAVKFTVSEIMGIQNLGSLVSLIGSKLKK